MLGVSGRKMKTLTVNTHTMILTGKGRQNLTCFVYQVYEINSKIFFLSRHFILGGVILDLDKYIFPWQTCVFGGLSQIRVVLYSGKYGNMDGGGEENKSNRSD